MRFVTFPQKNVSAHKHWENTRKMNMVGCFPPTMFIFRNPLRPEVQAFFPARLKVEDPAKRGQGRRCEYAPKNHLFQEA